MAHKRIENLYGLVLAGGLSNRMNRDKSTLEYHGKSQVEYCFNLLSLKCEKVFVSNREQQAQISGHKNLPQIHDTFLNIGPLGGILTAMTKFPKKSWLVLACDLPFVNQKTIDTLIHHREPSKIATAYISSKEPYCPEPLCAIYEASALVTLKKFLDRGISCPRKILINSEVCLIKQDEKFSLDNINNTQEYQAAVNAISARRDE